MAWFVFKFNSFKGKYYSLSKRGGGGEIELGGSFNGISGCFTMKKPKLENIPQAHVLR